LGGGRDVPGGGSGEGTSCREFDGKEERIASIKNPLLLLGEEEKVVFYLAYELKGSIFSFSAHRREKPAPVKENPRPATGRSPSFPPKGKKSQSLEKERK